MKKVRKISNLPRQAWGRKPNTRVKESGKIYSRKKAHRVAPDKYGPDGEQ